jgi:hypothetical protein
MALMMSSVSLSSSARIASSIVKALHNSGVIAIYIFVALLSSCASQPTAPWDAYPAAIRQVFPDGQYIAQRGFGETRAAAAVCRLTVDEGMQQRELGVFYFPKLQAVISSPSGTLFTFSAEGDQAAAVTPDVAKRRAYQSLVEKVSQTFSLETNVF